MPARVAVARALAPFSWMSQESQVEGCEHQHHSDIHCQPFPESVSEERDIYPDYDGYHHHHVKCDSYLFAHFSPWFNRKSMLLGRILPPHWLHFQTAPHPAFC
jgi:hypothetical protein